jgi:pimeloyl-ACP methyl ester carboxylesterase
VAPANNTTNSSPPYRATTSVERMFPSKRRAAQRTRSPTWDASSPRERSPRNGFRCASYPAKERVRDPVVRQVPPPEIDPFNFVTRSTVPTLMIHGRWDATRPVDTHAGPMFELLGTPEEHKRLALVDGGHIVPLNPAVREVLDWLDRYLGPVSPEAPAPR